MYLKEKSIGSPGTGNVICFFRGNAIRHLEEDILRDGNILSKTTSCVNSHMVPSMTSVIYARFAGVTLSTPLDGTAGYPITDINLPHVGANLNYLSTELVPWNQG